MPMRLSNSLENLETTIKENFCDAVFRFMRHPYLVLSSHKTVIDNSIV